MGIKGFIGVVLLTGSGCFAQADSITSAYIQKFPDKLSVQLFTLKTSNQFTIDYQDIGRTISVEPNEKRTLGVAVQYDFISFSLGFAPKFFTENKDNRDSKMTSFGLNLFLGKWMQHFDLYYQKGISLKEEGYEEVYLAGLKTIKIGGSTSYVFNDNYSFRALAFQNERQLKSTGSFAPSLSYYYTEFNGRKEPQLGGKSYFVDVALAPAYNYNWVVAKNILIAGGLSVGAGVTYTKDGSVSDTDFLTQAGLTLSLGYNSETFYGGVYAKGLVSNHDADTAVNMDDTIAYGTVFFGYRFDPPRFLKEKTEEIKEKIKI